MNHKTIVMFGLLLSIAGCDGIITEKKADPPKPPALSQKWAKVQVGDSRNMVVMALGEPVSVDQRETFLFDVEKMTWRGSDGVFEADFAVDRLVSKHHIQP
jgi:hypothetical protein